jgi:hypothetical protein
MKQPEKTTKVVKCSCVCPFQDNKFGKGKRVGNVLRKRDKTDPTYYRCTVCATVH